jgi:hypothetical protein
MYRNDRLSVLGLAILTLVACRSPHPPAQTLTGYQTIRFNQVAVMPFLAGQESSGADAQLVHPLDCTMAQFCEAVNELSGRAEEILTFEMQTALERRLDYRVVPQARASRAFDEMPLDRSKDTPRIIAQRFGKATGADHVILGKVWRFREREGDQGQGASVGFAVFLVQVDNGRRVWRGRFDRSQSTLLEDLREAPIFFKEGGLWLSAQELSRFGVEQVLRSFPEVAE